MRKFWEVSFVQLMVLVLVLILGVVVWNMANQYKTAVSRLGVDPLARPAKWMEVRWADGRPERLPVVPPDPNWSLKSKGVHFLLNNGEMWMRVDLYPMPDDPAEFRREGVAYDVDYYQYVFLSVSDQGELRTLLGRRTPALDRAVPADPPIDLSFVFDSNRQITYYGAVPWPEPDAVVGETQKQVNGELFVACKVDRGRSGFYERLKVAFQASTA